MWKFLECSWTSSPRWVYIVQYPIKVFPFPKYHYPLKEGLTLSIPTLVFLERKVRMFNPRHAGWSDKSLLKALFHFLPTDVPGKLTSLLTHTSNHTSCWEEFGLVRTISLRNVSWETGNLLLGSSPALWQHGTNGVFQFHKFRLLSISFLFYALLHLNAMKGTTANADIRPSIISNFSLLALCFPRISLNSQVSHIWPSLVPNDNGLWLC